MRVCRVTGTRNVLHFMRAEEASIDPDIHVMLDNYAPHKEWRVQRWLRKHPRVQFHFTPQMGFWLNLVERLVGAFTTRQLKRLAVNSVDELTAAMTKYLDSRNQHSRPFVRTASTPAILTKVRRGFATVASHQLHVNELAPGTRPVALPRT